MVFSCHISYSLTVASLQTPQIQMVMVQWKAALVVELQIAHSFHCLTLTSGAKLSIHHSQWELK